MAFLFNNMFSRVFAVNFTSKPQVIRPSNQTSSSSSSARGQGPTINQVRQPLPPGWEELKDAYGNVYYGNPGLQSVQWARPMIHFFIFRKKLNKENPTNTCIRH